MRLKMSSGMALRIVDWSEVLRLTPKNCPKTIMPRSLIIKLMRQWAQVSTSLQVNTHGESGVANIFLGNLFIQSWTRRINDRDTCSIRVPFEIKRRSIPVYPPYPVVSRSDRQKFFFSSVSRFVGFPPNLEMLVNIFFVSIKPRSI